MATLLQGTGTVNFEVYLAGTSRLMGIANVELSNLEMETVDTKGNGIAGTISMPIRANTSSFELKLTWRTLEKDCAELFKHDGIKLSLYGDQEHIDTGEHHFSNPQHRIEVSGIPKGLKLGKWEPSSTVDAENTLEIITLYYFIDSKEILAIDKLNYVFRNNGVDYAEAHRRAVGLV